MLTTGEPLPNSSERLGSEKTSGILHQAQAKADATVIDSPSVMTVAEAAVLVLRMDGVLLEVRSGVTKLAVCKQAVEQLRQGVANLLGWC